MKKTFTFLLVIGILFFSSCESDAEKKERLAYEEQQQIELEERRIEEEEKELFEKYKNNFLVTGSTPYSYCFGENSSCSSYGCSELSVKTPGNSDVVVTLKKGNEVVRHVYIRAGNTYTFQIPMNPSNLSLDDGNGWNPERNNEGSIAETNANPFRHTFRKEHTPYNITMAYEQAHTKWEIFQQNQATLRKPFK